MADGTAVESLTVTSLASPEPCRQLLGGWLIGGPDLLALSLLNAPFAVNSCRRGCAKGMKKTGAFGTGLAHASWGFAEMSVGETGFEPAASCSQSIAVVIALQGISSGGLGFGEPCLALS